MLDSIIPLKPKNKPENGAVQRKGNRTKKTSKNKHIFDCKTLRKLITKTKNTQKLNGQIARQYNFPKNRKNKPENGAVQRDGIRKQHQQKRA